LYGLFLNRDKPVGLAAMLISALNLVAFIPTMYCKLALGVKGDAFAMQMIFSGLFPAMATFMLIWIYTYTSYYEMEEAKIAALLVVQQTFMDNNSTNETSSTDATILDQDVAAAARTTTTMNAGEEPEF
jgi:phosphoglycerol transferase MdoB-like AlkP superfamily enzyme